MATSGLIEAESFDQGYSDPGAQRLHIYKTLSGSNPLQLAAFTQNSKKSLQVANFSVNDFGGHERVMGFGDIQWFHEHFTVSTMNDGDEWTIWVAGLWGAPSWFAVGLRRTGLNLYFKIWKIDYTNPIVPIFTILATSVTARTWPLTYHIDIKLEYAADAGGNHVCSLFVGPAGGPAVLDISATVAFANIALSNRVSFHQWNILGGKGTPGITNYHTNCIYTEESLASPFDVMDGQLGGTYHVVGHQFEKDVNGLWNRSNGAIKRYAHVDDDYESHGSSAGAYIWIDKNDVTTEQIMALVDKNVAGSVEGLVVCGEARESLGGTGEGDDLAGNICYTSGTNKSHAWGPPSSVLGSDPSVFHRPVALLAGDELITNAIFDTMQVSVRNNVDDSGIDLRIYKMIVQAVGPGLVLPAVNVSDINGDEASVCPAEGPTYDYSQQWIV